MHDETARIYDPGEFARGVTAERAALLPALADAYKAAASPDNQEVSRLVLVMGKDGFRPGAVAYVILQYVHLGLGEFGFTADGGQVFRFVVADLQPKLVTVRGRNLLRICDYIGLRRLSWIRQADRDFRPGDGAADTEPFIAAIEVADWQPPEPADGGRGA